MDRSKVGKVARGRVVKDCECCSRIMDLTLWSLGGHWRLRCSDVMWLRGYFRKSSLPTIIGWIREGENRLRKTNLEAAGIVQVWGARVPGKKITNTIRDPQVIEGIRGGSWKWWSQARWERDQEVGKRKSLKLTESNFWHVVFVVTVKYLGKRSTGQPETWAQGSVEKTRWTRIRSFLLSKLGDDSNRSLVTRLRSLKARVLS